MSVRSSITSKILLFWILSVFAAIGLVGGLFLYSLNRYHENISRQLLLDAQRASIEFIRQREEHLQHIADSFAERGVVVATMNLLSRYQNPQNYQPLVYDVEKKKLANVLASLTGISNHYHAVVSDGEDRISAFYSYETVTDGVSLLNGFVSYEGGNPVLMGSAGRGLPHKPMDTTPTDLLFKNFPAEPGRYAYVTDHGIGLALRRPIVRLRSSGEAQLIGNIVIMDILDEAVFRDLSAQIGVQVRPILQEFHDVTVSNFSITSDDFFADLPILFGGSEHHVIRKSAESIAAFSAIPTEGGKPVPLAFSLPLNDLTTGVVAFRDSALWGTILFLLIMTPTGLIFFNRIIRKPLGVLMEGVQHVTDGRYGERFRLQTNDELGVLAQSFEKMSGMIKKREDDLEGMVRDRTAELSDRTGDLEREIKERKATQAQLIQSSKMATLGEMATGVAHELNQPLNIINMAAHNILRKARKGDVSAEFLSDKLNRISTQVERAAEIIDHMRIFGRKPGNVAEELDPINTVRSAFDMIGQQLKIANISVAIDHPETCSPVKGHRVQLEQVLLNLLGNARDAIFDNETAADKSIQITVVDDLAGGSVLITVQDTGGGIDEEALEHIFEPFFTTKEVGKGTGLGLSISYGIIEEMGGTIEACNVDGGCRFTITLPAVTDLPAQGEALGAP